MLLEWPRKEDRQGLLVPGAVVVSRRVWLVLVWCVAFTDGFHIGGVARICRFNHEVYYLVMSSDDSSTASFSREGVTNSRGGVRKEKK